MNYEDLQDLEGARFKLMPEDLSFLGENLKRIVELGLFNVLVGASSTDILLRGSFRVTGQTGFSVKNGARGPSSRAGRDLTRRLISVAAVKIFDLAQRARN